MEINSSLSVVPSFPMDESGMVTATIQREIIRMDTEFKLLIQSLASNVSSEADLLRETRRGGRIIDDIAIKVDSLRGIAERMTCKRESKAILVNVAEHEKELEEDRKAFRVATLEARKNLQRTGRKELFGGAELTRRRNENKAHIDANRLTSLVERMASHVAQSEDTMATIVRSSETLGTTHNEYHTQASFINTGNKLLSKWERRELTDKIIISIFLLLYTAVIYYVLQKRVLSKFWVW